MSWLDVTGTIIEWSCRVGLAFGTPIGLWWIFRPGGPGGRPAISSGDHVTKYYVTEGGQPEREVTKEEFVRIEHSAGFRNVIGQPNEPATASFGSSNVSGRTSEEATPYMDNPPAVGAPKNWRYGYLPCGCRNNGKGQHV